MTCKNNKNVIRFRIIVLLCISIDNTYFHLNSYFPNPNTFVTFFSTQNFVDSIYSFATQTILICNQKKKKKKLLKRTA